MRLFLYKFIAGITSLFVLLLCLASPFLLYAVFTGISWSSQAPDWLGWFIILGGGIGACAAVLIHRFIICTIGGYPESIALRSWYKRYK